MNCHLWVVVVGVLAAAQLAAEDVDYSRLKLTHTLEGHEAPIRALAISPDGKSLASAGHDKTIRLWDVKTGKEKAVLGGHEASVRALCFSPDGDMLASGVFGGKDDDVVRLWDVAAGKQKASLTATKTATRFVTFSPDGNSLAWDDKGKSIRLCDLSTGKETVLPTPNVVREIVFSHDGRTLASTFFHSAGFQVWSADGQEIGAVKGDVTTVRFSSDGKALMAGEFRKITKWDVSNGKDLTQVETVAPQKVVADPFPRAHLSPDGKTLATVDKDLTVVNLGGDLGTFGERRCQLILMEVANGKERTLFETRGRENWFSWASYSPDGQTVALQNSDYSYTLVDVASGEQRTQLTAPDVEQGSGYPNIEFAPDGKTVAISRGTTIKLWVIP